ncbi:unnamed protein product, partial [Closterium sp. NIES-64]
SETLIAKLGGMKKLCWRFTHGKRIKGPSSSQASVVGRIAPSDPVDRVDKRACHVSETANRSALGLSKRPGKEQTLSGGSVAEGDCILSAPRPMRDGLTPLGAVKAEQLYQDKVLDQVSASLTTLRSMADQMGSKIDG